MLEALAKEVFLKYLLSQFCTLIIIFHDKAEESGMIFKIHLQFTVSLLSIDFRDKLISLRLGPGTQYLTQVHIFIFF